MLILNNEGFESVKEFKNLKVSVIIPMYNEEECIGACIHSIQRQNYSKELIEIIVVNGNSADHSTQIVSDLIQQDDRIKMFDNPNRKTPISLNIGIQHSTGDVVIILGAHTVIAPDFINQNIIHMKKMDVVCVGGTQKNIGKTYIQRAIAIAMGSPFGIPSAPYRYAKRERYVDTVVYAAYKREIFDEIGFFDEETLIAEDAELNWRIRKAGYKIFYTPKIISYYYPRKNITLLIKQLFRYGILRVHVIVKHFNAIKMIHLVPMLFVVSLFALLILGILNITFLRILALISAFYIIVILAASFFEAGKKQWKYLPVLPIIFPSMHLSWGFGFIYGLFTRNSKI